MNNNELQTAQNFTFEIDETLERRKPKSAKQGNDEPKACRGAAKTVAVRALVSLLLTLVLMASLLWTLLFTVAHGPSESMRDLLVVSAMRTSATQWIPYLVLSEAEIEEIVSNAELDPEGIGLDDLIRSAERSGE